MSEDFSQFFCPNKDCRHYGLRNQGNIRKRAIYGKDRRRLLLCSTCKKRFSETRCTVFFGTKYSRETIRQILLHVAEGVGVRATARLLGLSKDAVNRIILVAGEHCARVLENLLTDLNLTEVQLDELWVFIKKTKRVGVGHRPRHELDMDRTGCAHALDGSFHHRRADIGASCGVHPSAQE